MIKYDSNTFRMNQPGGNQIGSGTTTCLRTDPRRRLYFIDTCDVMSLQDCEVKMISRLIPTLKLLVTPTQETQL